MYIDILMWSWLLLSGDITYNLKLEVESMVWLDDMSNPGSLASQQLSAKFQKAVCRKTSQCLENACYRLSLNQTVYIHRAERGFWGVKNVIQQKLDRSNNYSPKSEGWSKVGSKVFMSYLLCDNIVCPLCWWLIYFLFWCIAPRHLQEGGS